MSDEDVLFDVHDDGVAVLTLHRPDRRNAWNPAMESRFYQVLDAADADPAVRVAVLTGSGTSFCPGMDSERLDRIAGEPMDLAGRISPAYTLAFRKPLIAAINGGCAGLGLVQALMCDVRFAATEARFSTAFVRRGLGGEYGVAWLLPRLIGTERALDLLLSGRVFDAAEARALGLVSRVVDRAVLLETALEYAHDIAANCSPTAVAVMKHQVLADADVDYPTGMRRAYRVMARLAVGADFREGIDSYQQGRSPQFAPLAADLVPAEVTGAGSAALEIDPMAP